MEKPIKAGLMLSALQNIFINLQLLIQIFKIC